MRKPFGTSCVCVALAVTAVWTARAELDEDVQYAMEILREEWPGVQFYEHNSRIKRVYGCPFSFGSDPAESAELFVLCHSELFAALANEVVLTGFPGAIDLVQPVMYEEETDTYKFYLCRYEQQRAGIPVFRADLRLLVRNEPNYPLVLAASSLRNLGDFMPDLADIPPDFDPTGCVEGDYDFFSTPELVIWPASGDAFDAGPRLAYQFNAGIGSPWDEGFGRWRFIVDAAAGEVLYRESLLHYTDITGNVSGLATEGHRAGQCEDEVSTPMSDALVYIDDPNDPNNCFYTDEAGDFVIPYDSNDPVTVYSAMRGRYFLVLDEAPGSDPELLSEEVTPPESVEFMHNNANEEYTRAQVNAYVQANIARDFVLNYSENFPTIKKETGFHVHVNWLYQPGVHSAWYDPNEPSINFIRRNDYQGFDNAAFSGIVHHEYGHHVQYCAGVSYDPP